MGYLSWKKGVMLKLPENRDRKGFCVDSSKI